MPLEPQAALETAVLNLLQTSSGSGGLGYTSANSGRLDKGMPPANCPPWFVCVWHDGSRQAGPNARVCLDEYHAVFVTITVQLSLPWDRWTTHRDALEAKVNDIRALVGKDAYNHVIVNAANTLAGYRTSQTPDGSSRVGFCEALAFAGADAIVEAGPDWFHAAVDSRPDLCGLYQTLRFDRCRRTQDWQYAD